MPITVASLHAYPVKSLRGHDLIATEVCAEGFAGDRRWVVTDTNGRFLSQREVRRMAQVEVRTGAGGIELSHAEAGRMPVPAPGPGAPGVTVTVWRFTGPARRASHEAERWLSAVLGREVWLAHMHDVSVRPVDPEFGEPADRVSFADGYPILVANTASLADLNARGESQHSLRQFRPNLVVTGAHPWAEDNWRTIRVGGVTLRIAKPCARCVVTTLDPDTGDPIPGDGPLAALATFHRHSDGGIIFGQNAVPQAPGEIRVGDVVEVLEAGPSNVVPMKARSV